jgi:hypothetical protein
VDKDRHRARCDESARVATARGLCGKDVEVVVVVTGNGECPASSHRGPSGGAAVSDRRDTISGVTVPFLANSAAGTLLFR